MTRRALGLLVIGIVLALVAVVSNANPRPVSGTATAAPVPGAPAVGDCAADVLPSASMTSDSVTAGTRGSVPVYPKVRFQPCSGIRYGEVVEVIGVPVPTVLEGDDSDGVYLDDPNLTACFLAGQSYLGMSAQPLFGNWYPPLMTTAALFAPTSRQQAAGQRWVACVVAPRNPGSWADTDPPPAPRYGSSLRDAVHTGNERDQLGYCSVDSDLVSAGGPSSCRQPHAFEVLGSGQTGDRAVGRRSFQTSCEQTIAQLTGLPDPTAGGLLVPVLDAVDDRSAAVTDPQIPAHSDLICAVATTGGRKLSGSLLALGRNPIPWA